MQNFNSQKGVATILMVLLVGLAMSVVSMGVVHSLKSTQQKQITVHTVTNAQINTWTAAEAVRQYFSGLTRDQIIALERADSHGEGGYIEFKFDGGTTAKATVQVLDTALDAVDDPFFVQAKIVGESNVGTPAHASSGLEVFFEASNTVSRGPEYADIQFHDDLDISGQVSLISTTDVDVSVEGNVTATSVNVTGIGNLRATGDITLNSGVEAKALYANGNVDLGGSAAVDLVQSRGDVRTDGAAKIGDILTNGRVELNGGDSSLVRARGEVMAVTADYSPLVLTDGSLAVNIRQVNGSDPTEIRTLGDLNISWNDVDVAWAGGDISVSAQTTLKTLKAHGSITCQGFGAELNQSLANAVASGDGEGMLAQGSITGCDTAEPHITENTTVDVPTVPVVAPITIDKPTVDVWQYRDQANYVFEIEGTKLRVTVRDVNLLTAGSTEEVYYLGDYSGGHKDYLCKTVDSNNNCTLPVSHNDAYTICDGFSAYNNCFSYANGTWVINGEKLAPGIMWFKGDLEVQNRVYLNTFLATGNIQTGSQHSTTALNFGGPAAVCTSLDSPSSKFEDLFPTNLCKVDSGVLDTDPDTFKELHLANIAFAAGGYDYPLLPDGSPDFTASNVSYSGGVIEIGANSLINGTVLAGQYLQTGGQTVVNGAVYAVSMGGTNTSSITQNALGANTTINSNNFSAPYYSNDLPTEDGGNNPFAGGSPAGSDKPQMKVKWARYL